MQVNKPVFIVGSPRSGTSILTWCLGQHPNMFPIPESNWLGDFAVHAAIGHEVGSARGERNVLSAMEIEKDEFLAHFGHAINELFLAHRPNLERRRKMPPSAEPKMRWVDGTPEYSHDIYGLRKLFPDAAFIHIIRGVREVVRSMLNFHRLAGTALVANEEEAYRYWLRTVRACVTAEGAFGPGVIHRLQYDDLLNKPQKAMQSLLFFLNEPYCSQCLSPLAKRINSSDVPEDFVAEDPATDQNVVHEALALSLELQSTPQSTKLSAAALESLELEFCQRIKRGRSSYR